jgi:hypothetical protein
MSLAAASRKAVIPTTYGRIYQSEAGFSHRKSPSTNIRFNPHNLPHCKTNAICCACPFFLGFLTQLVDGGLQYHTDFRVVYRSVVEKWFGWKVDGMGLGDYSLLPLFA